MYPIAGPGATVDNKFTEGDPIGGIPATVVTDDWCNDVQGELLALLTAAGITPAINTPNQVLKALRKITTGVVGQSRNLFSNVTSANVSATVTADELVLESALGGFRICLPGFNKTITLSGTGVDGMDTGAAPVSGWVAVYAIYNETTGVSGLLGKNATAGVQTETYTGASMPSGFSHSALVGVYRTTAASIFDRQMIVDRFNHFFGVLVAGTSGTLVAQSVAAVAPLNAKTIRILVAITSSAAGQMSAAICSTSGGLGFPGFSQITGVTTAGAQQVTGSFAEIPIIGGQIYWASSTANTTSAGFNSYGFSF